MKRKRTLLPKTVAALVSMALIVGTLWNAAPINVLAEELAEFEGTAAEESVEPGSTVTEESVEPEEAEGTVNEEPVEKEEPAPKETIPGEILPEKTVPEGTIPEDIAPEEAAPQETVPEAEEIMEEDLEQVQTFGVEELTAEGDTFSYTININVYGENERYPFEAALVKMVCEADGSETKGSYVKEEGSYKYTFELEKGKVYTLYIMDAQAAYFECAGDRDGGTRHVYALNFYDGDVLQNVQYVPYGASTKQPAPPEKEGYTFAGWMTENGGNTAFTFGFGMGVVTNVYAFWTENVPDDENKDWTLGEDGTLIILSSAGMADWDAHNGGKESQVVNVVIQGDVTEIEDIRFYGYTYTGLKGIDLSGSQIRKIGESAFQDCSVLQSVILPNCLETIGNWAFLRCGSLKEISIPGSVRELRGEAFSGCTSLEKVMMQGSVPPALVNENMCYNTFEDCGFVTANTKGIIVPEGSKAAYENEWSDWKEYITDGTVEDTRTKINAVQGQMSNFTAPAYGEEVQHPRLNPDIEQVSASICWEKKNEEGNWERVTDSHYTTGVYRLRSSIARYTRFAGSHVITPDCTLTVDGQVWTAVPNSYMNGSEANYIGMYSPEYVVSDPNASEGQIDKEVQKGEDAPDTVLAGTAEELAELILTEEEKQQAAKGTNVKIVLYVRDAGASVSSGDQAAVESALNDFTLGQYLNIHLLKYIGDVYREVSETKGKLTITIAVPDRLKNTDSQKTRTFGVIRVHGGQAEFLNDLDQSEDTITIETDRFSTYAVVYQDDAKDDDDNTGGNGNGGSGNTGSGDGNGGSGSTGGGNENGGSGSTGGGDGNGGSSSDGGNGNNIGNGQNDSQGSSNDKQAGNGVQNPESKGNGNVAGVQKESSSRGRDSEPKTGDATPIELYATFAMIAGLAYLLVYFTDARGGMSEETKKELMGTLVRWAKQGGRIRRLAALAAMFVLLVYYHGTKNLHRGVERETAAE